ncbi:prepilin-type N-terminal cleavage/methylation domain-containing protein [Fibrobacter sp. UWT2]|uniref:type II secretion system protein n=1 Tax=Fibrobacter sp. UWT2 TaxID=1896224 RepID=UPI00091C737C|nr:prepilin-type N-terminal cleavage/methylation domain-containing protein [Fibrobacter sp. UWT2]SHL01963.1 prepilin-type N-terminal cleavage/methylation domain-containing protein [Fibrobacter sp. UWT2]
MKKSGFTLMELLVYMAIVGIVVVIAGEAFSNSTKFRIRTDNMIKSSHEAEELASLLKADVQQTGAKYSKENTVPGDNDSFDGHVVNVYMDPTSDLSSFNIDPISDAYDNFTIRYLRYDDQGRYQATEQVEWSVDDTKKVLKRNCVLLDKLSSYNPKRDPCSAGAIEMATGVEKFKVYPAIPSIRSNADADHQDEQVFPPVGTDVFSLIARVDAADIIAPSYVSGGGTGVSLRGFARNYNDANGTINDALKQKNELYVAMNSGTSTAFSECRQLTLEAGIEYEISFGLAYPNDESDAAQLFVPGRDHMAVGFRNTSGQPIANFNDFLFYPPTSTTSQGNRTMRFTVPQKIENVCMAFTFATYSPLAGSGTVTISNLKLKRIAGSNYVFDPAITIPTVDKKNVKAFKIELEVGRGGKNGHAGETGHIDIVVPAPSNGVGI